MRLVNHIRDGVAHLGVLVGTEVVDAKAAALAAGLPDPGSTIAVLGADAHTRADLASAVAHFGSDHLVPHPVLTAPLLDPPRIFAIGRNYAEHAREGGAEIPEYPMIFFKPATAIVGDGDAIRIPRSTEKVDWEGELGVVIGTAGKYIRTDQAMNHVAGYVVANDVTARDWQRRTSQFDSGKMFDTFLPLGPAVVTADEVPEPEQLEVTTMVNDVTMQRGTTADMLFPIAALVSYLSQAVRLLPGDLILTGTPPGVGYARTPPVFLHHGDEVAVTIGHLGSLRNPVLAED